MVPPWPVEPLLLRSTVNIVLNHHFKPKLLTFCYSGIIHRFNYFVPHFQLLINSLIEWMVNGDDRLRGEQNHCTGLATSQTRFILMKIV